MKTELIDELFNSLLKHEQDKMKHANYLIKTKRWEIALYTMACLETYRQGIAQCFCIFEYNSDRHKEFTKRVQRTWEIRKQMHSALYLYGVQPDENRTN